MHSEISHLIPDLLSLGCGHIIMAFCLFFELPTFTYVLLLLSHDMPAFFLKALMSPLVLASCPLFSPP